MLVIFSDKSISLRVRNDLSIKSLIIEGYVLSGLYDFVVPREHER